MVDEAIVISFHIVYIFEAKNKFKQKEIEKNIVFLSFNLIIFILFVFVSCVFYVIFFLLERLHKCSI